MATYAPDNVPETNRRSNPAETGVVVDLVPREHVKMERRKYKRTLYWFGFIEIILGIASCGVSIVGLVITSSQRVSSLAYASSGLWCGLPMMTSGILGVRINAQSSPCIIKSNMAASVLSSIFMAILFTMSMLAALSPHQLLMAIYVFLSIIASAGFILNIVHAVFCCATICCIIPHLDYRTERSSSTRGPIVRYMLVDGQRLVLSGYPGPPPGERPLLPPMLEPPPIVHHPDPNKSPEPGTPPPAYTSRENLSDIPSTSAGLER